MSSQILSFPLPILFFLFFLISWVIWKKPKATRNSKLLNLPHGPIKFPIIGNLHNLIGGVPHHLLRDLAKKYGSVMHLQLGETPTVIISSAESAKEVLKIHDLVFANRPFLLVADIILYKASDIGFAPYGDRFSQLKKICVVELFSSKRVQLFRSIREAEVSNFIRSISSRAGLPINLTKLLHSLSSTITVRAAFGDKFPQDREEFVPVANELLKTMSGLSITDLFPSSKLLHVITGVQYRFEKLHKKIDLMLEKIINGHRISRATSKISTEDEDLLHVLLNLQEQGTLELPLSIDSIKAVVLDIFVAGTDTSALVVAWAMSELIKNPRVMQKAQAEVRQIFDGKKIVDEAIIDELKYLKLVVKETLRLHPVAPLLGPRESREQCQISGYDIPSKTRVLVNVWAIGRDPKYWFEAEKFFPERFMDNSINYKGANFEYLPFGSGRRICPGILFGLANVELALAHLLYHFDWELPNGKKKEDLNMDECFGAAVGRKYDLQLIPIPYHQPTTNQ
ncbi:desmethyl-deoxy-podophyllotoxin synthase-like [Mercurialis annua]|uniref:desmethyl-deoxy-podophyllotoxin synthase-like n=1 Tax=Mercurialis annua TaxID=3986 RepID=UPI00215F1E0D|nr:desmethyl-deoxy-podophyllotoxin synthase-like [Mercurialis annua]